MSTDGVVRMVELSPPTRERCEPRDHDLVMSAVSPVAVCLRCGCEWEAASDFDALLWFSQYGTGDETLDGLLRALVAAKEGL